MKKFWIICISFALALCLLGCDNPEAKSGEATVCGATNNCPLKVTVKVDGDGKILEAEIDEYLSLYEVGALSQKEQSWTKFDVEIMDVDSGYSKYARVGDRVFVFEDGVYKCGELSFGSYDEYVKTNEGAKWYIDEVSKGNFDLVDVSGNDYGVPYDQYDDYKIDKAKWTSKMDNGFHEGVEYDNGWKENIYKLITHLKNHGFYDYAGNEKPSGKQKTYKVGKYDTLVDLDNFHDYMLLARKAYDKAMQKVTDQ